MGEKEYVIKIRKKYVSGQYSEAEHYFCRVSRYDDSYFSQTDIKKATAFTPDQADKMVKKIINMYEKNSNNGHLINIEVVHYRILKSVEEEIDRFQLLDFD